MRPTANAPRSPEGSRRGLLRLLGLLGLVTLLGGCPKDPLTVAYIVRHAEKATTPPEDPTLTAEGQAHAVALADRLGAQPIVAVFSTDTTRTRQTAAPLAEKLGLTVQIYSSPADLAALIKSTYAGKAVAIVGHSNTVPQIISALGATPPAEIASGIPDDQFDNLYMMLISADSAGVTALTY